MTDLIRSASGLFDSYVKQLSPIAEAMDNDTRYDMRPSLAALSHIHATKLDDLIGQNALMDDQRKKLMDALHAHPWHQKFLLKSQFIQHALTKPRGYAGDADLMEMICKNDDRGATPFAMAKNRVYLDLPAAEAVRRRSKSLRSHLENLPSGARVLNLACGPALEVMEFLALHPKRDIRFLLLDHDPNTISNLRDAVQDRRYECGLANAFEVMKGVASVLIPRSSRLRHITERDFKGWRQMLVPWKYARRNLAAMPKFDLVYSSGLYDYVRYTRGNLSRGTTGLTAQLFSFVKVGGELLIGNFRAAGPKNPHAQHHMTMMDMYSDWRLIYRSDDEIGGFADGLAKDNVAVSLLNEELKPITEGGAIGFLRIVKIH